MTPTNPDNLPLSSGLGSPDSPCAMSKAALVHAHHHGYLTPETIDQVFTDRPCWVNESIAAIVPFVQSKADLHSRGSAQERMTRCNHR